MTRGSRGMTMIEVLIAMGILTLLFALGLVMSMDTFRGYSRRSERDTLVSVLERARSLAMANVDQQKWGACYDDTVPDDPQYVVFSGANYAGALSTLTVPANPGVVPDLSLAPAMPCTSGGVVFDQLTGNTTAASITLTEGSITSTIALSAMGRIDW